MKGIWKKSLAMLLSLVMVLGMFPVSAFAEDVAGECSHVPSGEHNYVEGVCACGAVDVAPVAEEPALPTATVTEIENENLTFAMNFKADAPTDAQLAKYGNWYADFELTVNKNVTFNANGGADGYLSGQYDAWSENWVNVPFENVSLKAGETLKIMEYASELMGKPGLKLTYDDIVNVVKNFDCGVYFTEDFLIANPDLKVTLELRMYNADATESHVIGSTYTFTVPAPALPTATVTEIENKDLTFAMNFKADEATKAQLAYYGDWYADFELTVNQNVTLNANGGANGYLSGQYDAWSENWVNVPFEKVSLAANTPLKIMEYASELMGKPGLKYTYKEVYEAVKDFDCGVFFEPAFLKANPDLKVTLELKMYNPADATENYVIGDTYIFTLPARPTATVKSIENKDLTFAMNFKADEATKAQLAYYGDWYADFELTVNKDVTFNANGGADGYLSGQYDAWSENWVNVPFEKVSLAANTPLKIMEYASELMGKPGLKYTYKEVYEAVKDFDCGVFFEPAFLKANPDLKVTLELKMYNPADATENYVIGDTYIFTLPALPTATVKSIENEDLTFAMNFKADEVTEAQLAYYGDWYADFELTVNQNVTLNANGGADGYLSGQYDKWSENWVNVPFEKVSLAANTPLKIMEYASELMGKPGLKYTYKEVYEVVKDFDCGMFLEPEFLMGLEEELVITLSLKMYNPADEKEGNAIGETYTFRVPVAPELPTATVTEIENEDLTFAMNFKADEATDAQLAYYGDWYADFELTVNKDVTLNANLGEGVDGYLSGQYDAWSDNWVNVPFENVNLKAGETLKIMEYASKLMGQPGLKYTYGEIYEFVKDFDCGMFFTKEFLKANPDLEVTLSLKMYNPTDEEYEVVIGGPYKFCGSVAQNVDTRKYYNDVSVAMTEAKSGETVILLKDAETPMLYVLAGVELDLNGFTLNAPYTASFGHIIDSNANKTGLLKTNLKTFLIQDSNKQLPVGDVDGGYRFVEVRKFNAAYNSAAGYFEFQPKFEASKAAHDLLLPSGDVTGVKVIARVSWVNDDGDVRSQDFVYSDEFVNTYISNVKTNNYKNYNKSFTLTLTNVTRDLDYQVVVNSETKVEFASSTTTVKAPQTTTSTTTEDITINNTNAEANKASALVQEGTKLENNATADALVLTVDEIAGEANITLGANEVQKSVDVHIDGIAADNTVPMIITIEKFAAPGLNEGNLSLYHVENGATNPMTQVFTLAEVDAHNEFYYDPATGDVTMALATFSEIALVAEEPKWEGKFDYTWYDASKTELTIANADQLAAFGAIVGGMAEGIKQDSFTKKTVKLIADINLGYGVEGHTYNIFYPIGYNSSDGKYGKTGVAVTTGFYNFCGTFDGNGHTISNFYQNTWEMKGDNNYYDATLQYYRDGMGLFGKVYGGTVKNLTVSNFSSDGEYTTTGVIAAYADGATFENISVFDCNPRVYNIGNGGIVGCVGWYAEKADLKTTFKNITVDNSNKISALWGSYDVACGGIVGQYYPTSGQTSANKPANGGISFENCHVSAQMDVYNDVCANYQYYAYRYTGMLIGSVRDNVTIDGHVYPKMDGITAKDCTVHFGTWNDYYYCEIIDNTTASYTHDYQMSRLTEIKAIDDTTITYLDGTTGTVPASGRANYVIVDYTKGHGTENATCYHFKDGAVWTHDMGGIQTGIDENGDGQDDLKEDKQHIYLEFNNLVTGYGWGVTTKGVGDLAGVTILDREVGNSVEKFAKADTAKASYSSGEVVNIGELFAATEAGNAEKTKIQGANVMVAVSPVGENSTAGGTYDANTTDWTQGSLTFSGNGAAKISITDYNFCKTTTLDVVVNGKEAFKHKFPNTETYLYRVGNAENSPIKLNSLFEAVAEIDSESVSIVIEKVNKTSEAMTFAVVAAAEDGVDFTYTPDKSAWEKGTIQFKGVTGPYAITIKDKNSAATTLYVEVIDAKNVTSAVSATSNNVVLLNDTSGSFAVSGEWGFYGNGFTITLNPNSHSTSKGNGYAGYITMNGGTLDNVRIEGPVYAESNIYQSQALHNGNDADDPADYFRNAVNIDSGNAKITNSYISGARVPVLVKAGSDVTIENSRISGGAYANIEVLAANSLKLKNVVTEQTEKPDSYGKGKNVIGLGIVLNKAETKLILEGVTQYNWINQTQWSDMLGNYESSFPALFKNDDYQNLRYTKDGITVVNSGIIYACDYTVENFESQTSGRISGYTAIPVTAGGKQGIVYTMTHDGSNNKLGEESDAPIYVANTQNPVPPIAIFDYINKNNEPEQSGKNDYCYYNTDSEKFMISFDQGSSKAWEYDILTLKKGGNNVTYEVSVEGVTDGANINKNDQTIVFSKAGDYTVTYTYSDTCNYELSSGQIETYTTKYQKKVYVTVFVVEPEANPTTFTFGTNEYKVVTAGGLNYAMPNVSTEVAKTISGGKVTNDAIGSKTIDGETVFYPIINMYKVGSSLSGYYNYFPVFKGVTINDADGTTIYDINTTEMPGNLIVVGGFIVNHKTGTTGAESANGTAIFTYSTGKTIKLKTVTGADNGNLGLCYYPDSSFTSGTSARDEQTIVVKYCYTDTNGKAYYYYIGYYCASGTTGIESAPSTCVTSDTLVMLADGTQKRVDMLTRDDILMAWDFEVGEYVAAPILALENHADDNYRVLNLKFSDGSVVKTIDSHGFFDADINDFVYISEDNVEDYVGHNFVKLDGESCTEVQLDGYTINVEYTGAWWVQTAMCNNFISENMLSMTTPDFEGWFDYFDITDDMKYDEDHKQAEIEKYGLCPYEELSHLGTYEDYIAMNAQYLNILIGRGVVTMEDVLWMLERYI